MTLDNLIPYISCFLNNLLEASVNKNFTIPLLASGLGAYLGATSAQRVIERLKKEENLLKEIRNVNAAIAIVAHINYSLISNMRDYKSYNETFFNN